MTLGEIINKYDTKECATSSGDTLRSISIRLYGTFSEKTALILRLLNPRFDWRQLPAGERIRFIPKEAVQLFDEVR